MSVAGEVRGTCKTGSLWPVFGDDNNDNDDDNIVVAYRQDKIEGPLGCWKGARRTARHHPGREAGEES